MAVTNDRDIAIEIELIDLQLGDSAGIGGGIMVQGDPQPVRSTAKCLNSLTSGSTSTVSETKLSDIKTNYMKEKFVALLRSVKGYPQLFAALLSLFETIYGPYNSPNELIDVIASSRGNNEDNIVGHKDHTEAEAIDYACEYWQEIKNKGALSSIFGYVHAIAKRDGYRMNETDPVAKVILKLAANENINQELALKIVDFAKSLNSTSQAQLQYKILTNLSKNKSCSDDLIVMKEIVKCCVKDVTTMGLCKYGEFSQNLLFDIIKNTQNEKQMNFIVEQLISKNRYKKYVEQRHKMPYIFLKIVNSLLCDQDKKETLIKQWYLNSIRHFVICPSTEKKELPQDWFNCTVVKLNQLVLKGNEKA